MPLNFIITALYDFIQQERKTNLPFLSRHSHCYKHQYKLLVVSRADTDDIEAVRKTARRDGTSIHNDWYTFTDLLRADGLARTVAIRRLSESDLPVKVDDLTIVEVGLDNKNPCEAAAWIRDTYCTTDDDMYAIRFSDMPYNDSQGFAHQVALILVPQYHEKISGPDYRLWQCWSTF